MRLNKKFQCAFLLCMYLARAGKARIEDAAINMNLSKSLLQQVAMALRKAGLIESIRGPGGGYELNPGVTVLEVLTVFTKYTFLSSKDNFIYQTGPFEHRSLWMYVSTLNYQIYPVLTKTFKEIHLEVSESEKKQFEGLELTLEN